MQFAVEIAFYGGLILALPFLALLIAVSAITPSWHWVVGTIAFLFVGLGVMWGLVLAGFQPSGMTIRMEKQYLVFTTSGALVGTAIYGVAMAWYYERPHES